MTPWSHGSMMAILLVFDDALPERLALSAGKLVVARVEGCERAALVRQLRFPTYLGEDLDCDP